MRTKVIVTITALTTCASLAFGTVAEAYNKPSQAQRISLGITFFGDTRSNGNTQEPFGSVWQLPALLAQDVVTLSGRAYSGDERGIAVGIAGDVDDFDYAAKWFNNYELASDSSLGNLLGTQGSRLQLRASRACTVCYLELGKVTSPYFYGSYSFTVESIQHALGLGMTSPASIRRKGSIRATASLTNGVPVPDGFDVALIVRKGPKKWVRVARASGGQLSFRLKLPTTAKGKVKLSLSRGADTQYLATSTKSVKTRIT